MATEAQKTAVYKELKLRQEARSASSKGGRKGEKGKKGDGKRASPSPGRANATPAADGMCPAENGGSYACKDAKCKLKHRHPGSLGKNKVGAAAIAAARAAEEGNG